MTAERITAERSARDPLPGPAQTFRELLQDQALAEKIAESVAARLQPGCGPMVVPEWVVDAFARIGQHGGYVARQHFPCVGGDYVAVEGRFNPDGSLFLTLEVNGQPRVWEGVLRGPARGA